MKIIFRGKYMKKIKKLFFMIILLMTLGIGFNISNKVTNVQAFNTTDNFHYTVIYKLDILYWDSSTTNCEVVMLEIGANLRASGLIWVARNDEKVFDSGSDFPILGNLVNGENIVPLRSTEGEWYYYLSDYHVYVKIENNTVVPLDINVNYDINNFDINFSIDGGLYLDEEIVKSVEIDNSFYFKNLHQNIGNNVTGSCAYVAIGTLLSYYDIFYNNDVVTNTYVVNGKKQKFVKEEYVDSKNIIGCEESPGYTETFHQFLMNDVGRKGLNYGNSINYLQSYNVLNYYLNSFTNLSTAEYNTRIIYNEPSMIEELDKGNPIYLGFSSWATQFEIDKNQKLYRIEQSINNGHAVVAYGYEKMKSGKTYFKCHSGWLGNDCFSEMIYLPYDNSAIAISLDVNKNENNCSRAYVYKNQDTGDEYSICPKCENYTKDDISIHCRSDHFAHTAYLSANKRITYEFDTECTGRYDISIESNNEMDLMLFDEDKNLVEIGTYIKLSENEYNSFIVKDLSKGRYYLKVSYYDTTHSGTIHTTIQPRNTTPIPDITELSEVDVLPHLHDNHNVFRIYTNQNKLYQLTLVATATQPIDYPDNAITITDTEGTIVSRFPDNTLQATTTNASNNLLFYAEKGKSYNLHINIEQEGIQSLRLFITTQDEFTSSTMTNYDSYTEPLTTINGDSGKSITIEREGTYQFHFYYKGTQTTDTYMTLLKQNAEGEYTFLTSQALNKTNRHLYYTDTITAPTTYFIAYINATENETIDIDIGKEITQIFTIKTDISTTDCGSEVKLNNGTLGGTTITQGFTRNVYLGENAPDTTSRLKYNWYSLNPNIAKISAYGTITAVGVGTTTIQAVYKDDPSQVAELEITVIPYTEQTEPISLQYGMDVRMDGTLTGSEVTSGKGNSIPVDNHPEVTIHIGYTRLICLGADSPNSSIQDFTWTVVQEEKDTGMVTVSSYGTIKGTQAGTITVKGTYKYNPNYQVSIRIQVVN